MPEFGFVSASYTTASVRADCQRAMNLMPEVVESGAGKSKLWYMHTPGLETMWTLPTSPVRGLWPGANRLFAVSGSRLYELFAGGSYNDRGDVESNGQPVQIFPNGAGTQLYIVSNDKAWVDSGSGPTRCHFVADLTQLIIDASDATKITSLSGPATFTSDDVGKTLIIDASPGFTAGTYTITAVTAGVATLSSAAGTLGATNGTATEIMGDVAARFGAFLDGYFIAVPPDSAQVFISNLNDGQRWEELDVGVKEAYPDHIGAIIADHEALFILGDEQGAEVWHNTGPTQDDDYPIHRDYGGFIHYAILASWSLVRLDDGIAWIAGNEERGGPFAVLAKGFMPARVSTAAIEAEWATYSQWSDAVAYSAIENGHHVWVISFPTANKTWVYDRTQSTLAGIPLWHERGYWTESDWGRVRGAFHAFVGVGTGNRAEHYVGDYSSGNVYRQSFSLYTDDGATIHRSRTTPHSAAELKRLAHSRLQLEHKPGISPTLAWSDDGGETFTSGVPADGPLFAVGDPSKILGSEWRRLGRARDRVYRADITDAAAVAIVNAYLEAHP
jgi:hypothetical protein